MKKEMKLPGGIKFKDTRHKIQVVCFLLIVSYIFPKTALAFDVASSYVVSDTQANSGDIISSVPSKGLVRSDVAYDSRVFGVISDDPLAVYKDVQPPANDRPVLRNGDATVNVSDYNGGIQPGDYITTSPIPGKGMKGLQSGYVIGIAISNVTPAGKFSFQNRQLTLGQVKVALNIQYAELTTARSAIHLFDSVNAAFFRNVQDPEKFTSVIRYMVGGLIALGALALGFVGFSRSLANGISAMGRNPLAKQAIRASMILQTVLTIITTFGAIILAFIIIRI